MTFEALGELRRNFRYQLTGGHGLPIEGEWYTYTFRNALIGRVDSRGHLWRDYQDSRTVGFQAGGAPVFREGDKFIRYAGVATQYFASVIVVDDEQEAGVAPNFIAWARPTVERTHRSEHRQLDDITVRVISTPFDLEPGQPVVHRYLLYNGPVKVKLLGHLGKDEAPPALVKRYRDTLQLATLTDYHWPGFMSEVIAKNLGWTFLLIRCTNLMHDLLWLLHTYVMPWNYGVCIILLTLVVRGLLFPLSRRQAITASRMQEKLQELAPEFKKLEEKYKGDAMAFNRAKHDLMMKRGVNPLAMTGTCWLMLLQMPIFLGLFYALQESIHFRLPGSSGSRTWPLPTCCCTGESSSRG